MYGWIRGCPDIVVQLHKKTHLRYRSITYRYPLSDLVALWRPTLYFRKHMTLHDLHIALSRGIQDKLSIYLSVHLSIYSSIYLIYL